MMQGSIGYIGFLQIQNFPAGKHAKKADLYLEKCDIVKERSKIDELKTIHFEMSFFFFLTMDQEV